MAGAALGAQVAGTALSAYGSYQGGLAQQNYYKYLASNARTEEGLVQRQADEETNSAQDQGAYQSKMASRHSSEVSGAQTAGEAANGISGSVTAQDIARDTFDKSKMDQLAIKYNADVASWRAQNNANLQKWNLENQANQDEVAGRNAKKAGTIGTFSSLLSGSGQVAGSWLKSRPYAPA